MDSRLSFSYYISGGVPLQLEEKVCLGFMVKCITPCKKILLWQKLNFVGLVSLVQQRKPHTYISWTGNYSKQSSYILCMWHYENYLHQIGEQYSALSTRAAAIQWPKGLTEALVKACLPGENESFCFDCLSNTSLQNVFQEGSDGRYYKLPLSSLREELSLAGNISEIFIVFWKLHFISNLFTVKHSES